MNPSIFTSPKLTEYIIEAARGSDIPVGLFVAASIKSQEKKTEEALALLEETIKYEIDSLAFARVVYYQYLQSLVNFEQFDKLKAFVEKLFDLRNSIAVPFSQFVFSSLTVSNFDFLNPFQLKIRI